MKKQTFREEKTLSVIYGNSTPLEFLNIIKALNLKEYKLIRLHENFFIWQKMKENKPKSEYIRLSLNREGWDENTLFYWDLELSFKPWAYNHNHRKDAHVQSEAFKCNEMDKFKSYFLNMIDMIRKVKE